MSHSWQDTTCHTAQGQVGQQVVGEGVSHVVVWGRGRGGGGLCDYSTRERMSHSLPDTTCATAEDGVRVVVVVLVGGWVGRQAKAGVVVQVPVASTRKRMSHSWQDTAYHTAQGQVCWCRFLQATTATIYS